MTSNIENKNKTQIYKININDNITALTIVVPKLVPVPLTGIVSAARQMNCNYVYLLNYNLETSTPEKAIEESKTHLDDILLIAIDV